MGKKLFLRAVRALHNKNIKIRKPLYKTTDQGFLLQLNL